MVVCRRSRKIICAAFANGKRRDFRLFRESGVRIALGVGLMADTGYQGIVKMRRNRAISSGRVANEHAIGFVKRFRIVSERYRGRRRREV